MIKRKMLLKVSIYLSIISLSLVGLIGFAHTKAGRPMLMKLARYYKGDSCPLGYDKVATFAEQEKFRLSKAENMRGMPHARFRSVMGFVLGRTNRSEIMAWTKQNSGTCKALKTTFESECSGPLFNAEGTTLWLEFDSHDTLVSVRGIEKFKDLKSAIAFYRGIKNSLQAESTLSPVETGAVSELEIQKNLLAQASLSSGYDNYSAVARLTNVGSAFEITHNFMSF
jgi:hypothetical protein